MSLPPVLIRGDLFRELDGHLITLLRSLSHEDWRRPTVCSEWAVRDIASHLLDGTLRRLSSLRDGYVPGGRPSFSTYQELVDYIHSTNADWTRATQRLSPQILTWLLEITGPELAALIDRLDPFEMASIGVAWAGEAVSPNWFDIAREYTEKWHHQQQIALAVGLERSPIAARHLYFPVLDTFMRALPFTFRDVEGNEGDRVTVTVLGDAGGGWTITRLDGRWDLTSGAADNARARVVMPQDVAWRVLTKRYAADRVRELFPSIEADGESTLVDRILETVSIMA